MGVGISRCVDPDYYCRPSSGKLVFDPGQGTKHFEPWWAIVSCDEGIGAFYRWLCKRHGIPLNKNALWGPHISFIKGEQPLIQNKWGSIIEVNFFYSNHIRIDNGRHAWLDVWSDDLIQLRDDFGLPPKVKMSYHMTLGNLV